MAVKTDVIQSINPADESLIEEVPVTEPEQVEEIIQQARESQRSWSKRPLDVRIEKIKETADEIEQNQDELAKAITEEEGKPLSESKGEVSATVHRIRYFCDQATEQLQCDEISVNDDLTGVLHHRPYGLVTAIKPWNFPINIPVWTLVPALLAGNTVILKPSELTPVVGRRLVECFPDELNKNNVINLIQGGGETGRRLVDHDGVDYVSFIGSRETGEWIYKASAEHLRPVSLELGGKDPMLVLEDADLEKAVDGLIQGGFRNCGQVCCGVERCLVHKSLFDEFVEKAQSEIQDLVIGDGVEQDVDIGPMIRETELNRVQEHIRDAEDNGAEIFYSKEQLPDTEKGFWQAPALVTDVTKDMKIMNEETFGPVVTIQSFEDDREAIREANRLEYGLSALVYGEDSDHMRSVSQEIEAGSIGVNQPVGSIVELPWGGVKKSGLGRMLGPDSLKKFTTTVTERWHPSDR